MSHHVKDGLILFNSPLYHDSTDDGEDYLPPLGLGYIATQLNDSGLPSKIIDCVYERIGVSDIVRIINSGSFSNIGFNVFSVNMDLIHEILSQITRFVHIFIGGKATEYVWQEIVSWKISNSITFIIGEGELIIPALLDNSCLERPIWTDGYNCVYQVSCSSCYYPSDLDTVHVDRALFSGREIQNKYGHLEACIVTSRGCIYDCAFCGGARSANPNITVRVRSKENILHEISEILSLTPKVSSIRVLDDLFLQNRQSIKTACSIFETYTTLHWRCMAHVNSFRNNLDLLPQLKSSNCDEVFVGIESGSNKIRQRINKLGSVSDVISVITALLQAGINVKGYFICGFPSETTSQMLETQSLATELKQIANATPAKFQATAFQFRPYHGTRLYNELFNEQSVSPHYINSNNLVSAKRQYNFSVDNYSATDDDILTRCIKDINTHF